MRTNLSSFYIVASAALIIYNIVFIVLGVIKGYVYYIFPYAICTVLSSIVFDYGIISYLVTQRNHGTHVALWITITFGVGVCIVTLCSIIQVIISPILFNDLKKKKEM